MNVDEVYEMAKLGVETEKFLMTSVGKYLLERAEIAREKAINEFKTVDPMNTNEVRRIQTDLDTPDRIVKWLSDAIDSGRAAYDALRNQEAEAELS